MIQIVIGVLLTGFTIHIYPTDALHSTPSPILAPVGMARRNVISNPILVASAWTLLGDKSASAKCRNIDECREEGERRIEQQEKEKGPIVNLGNGVRFRESKKGGGDIELKQGDAAEITYMVTTTGGDYMWSFGRNVEPGLKDYGETIRVVLGKHDVPIAVEIALEGMRQGGIRKVEMPPSLGFSTSSGQPAPSTFSGKKKLERYQALLTGNGLQPGYAAELIFEVEVVKIKPQKAGPN